MSESNIGTCKFCGQTRVIETVGDISEAERDAMATDLCICGAAQAEKRQRERAQRIEEYIEDNFDEMEVGVVKGCIDLIEQRCWKSVTINMNEDKSCKIWMDADAYLNIRVKALTTKELKV